MRPSAFPVVDQASRRIGRSLGGACRCLVLLMACVAASAVEFTNPPKDPPKDPPRTDPTADPSSTDHGNEPLVAAVPLISLSAKKGINISMVSDHPSTSTLSGGVRVTYEKIIVAADAMDYVQSPFGGVGVPIFADGRMLPGPDGPTADRVLLDTRATQLPKIGFRGLLTPGSAHVTRLDPDSKTPKQVHYHILLTQLGDFAGDLRRGSEWYPHLGWGDHADIDAIADLTDAGLTNLRIKTLVLHGSEQPKRKAMIVRLKKPPEGTAPDPKDIDIKALDMVITVVFDDEAKLDDIRFGSETEITGSGSLLPSGASQKKK